jgi:hypothetical protein
LKQTADYEVGPLTKPITQSQSEEAITLASRFIETITAILSPGEPG